MVAARPAIETQQAMTSLALRAAGHVSTLRLSKVRRFGIGQIGTETAQLLKQFLVYVVIIEWSCCRCPASRGGGGINCELSKGDSTCHMRATIHRSGYQRTHSEIAEGDRLTHTHTHHLPCERVAFVAEVPSHFLIC